MPQIQYKEHSVEGIKIIEVLTTPQATQGNSPLNFFCMHGYGANGFDLAGLAPHLALPPGSRLFFPEGPIAVDLGMGYTGRAWFPIDWNEIERIRREGGLRDLSKTLPAGMAEARDQVISVLKALNAEPSQTILAGFSQGAMLATEIALSHEAYFAGLLILSGTLVNRVGWETQAEKKFRAKGKLLQFLQSHGRLDPVLPFQAAERLHTLLTAHGGVGELVPFEGQHEIPMEVVQRVNRWFGGGGPRLSFSN